ncbi:MAG: hypothetical protein JRF40_15355, partial [Deltaproteobacteria bacterium]|nr:hypothetical protein [Deltaproteobacteria bacterium]
MKKLMVLCGIFSLVFGVAGAVSATTITYDYLHAGDDTLTTRYAWATVETFDDDSLPWTWDGSGEVVSGEKSGKYAAPFNSSIMSVADTTDYLTVPNPERSGSYRAYLEGTYNYFGIFWGSVDDYNSLKFYEGDDEVASFTGADITNPANGNQEASSTN